MLKFRLTLSLKSAFLLLLYFACDNFTLAIFAPLLFSKNNLTGKEYNSLDQGMHEKLVLLFIYPSK